MALLQQYVEMWARGHQGTFPAAADVAAGGAVGLQPGVPIWPQSPWSHAAMTQGPAKGDFTYALTAAGCSLRVHLSTGKDWVLVGPLMPAGSLRLRLRSSAAGRLAVAGVHDVADPLPHVGGQRLRVVILEQVPSLRQRTMSTCRGCRPLPSPRARAGP